MANDGGPAFPEFTQDPWGRPLVKGGASLRDYFAGQALVGLVSDDGFFNDHWPGNVAAESYKIADAMLKARGEDA